MSRVMEGVDRLTQIAGRNRLEMLLFRLTDQQIFGINVFKVREVLKCPPLRPIPQAHHHIRGVMHARGQTITIIDLAAVLGHGRLEGTAEEFVIVTEYSAHVQGYLVQSVERIVNMRWDEVKPPPPGVGAQNYMIAVTSLDDQLIEVLDVERILSEIVGPNQDVREDIVQEFQEHQIRLRHVLVADDSTVARKQVTRVLDQLGITYDVAENGRQALQFLQDVIADGTTNVTDRYGMLISDIEMPEMDGYTLTKSVKEDPQLRSLFVCLHTSLSGNFNQSMAEGVGADRLVPKFDPNDLAELVKEFLCVENAPEVRAL